MEPIRPTTEALGKLDQLGATAVQAGLQRIAGQVEAIVPQCVGLSLRPPQVGLSILLRFMPRRVGRSVGGGLRGWSLV